MQHKFNKFYTGSYQWCAVCVTVQVKLVSLWHTLAFLKVKKQLLHLAEMAKSISQKLGCH